MDLNQLFGQEFAIKDSDLLGFDKMAKGKYRTLINTYKIDQFNGGKKLVFEAIITDGPSANRKIWLDFMTEHSNAKVVEIAIQNMKKLMAACGKRDATTVDAALGCMPVIELSYQKDKNDPEKEWPRYSFLDTNGQPYVYNSPQVNPQQAPQQAPMQQASQMQKQEPQQDNVPPPWAQ